MSEWDWVAALFIQPQFGLPLLMLGIAIATWSAWETRTLPSRLAPYSIRPPWTIDTVRVLHEALMAGQLGTTIQVTFTWLSQQFRRRFGLSLSEVVGWRRFFYRIPIPERRRYRKVVRTLQRSFSDARYAEDPSQRGWLAERFKPRARARAERLFATAIQEVEGLRDSLGVPAVGGDS